jgi:hypothetical protein
MIFLNAHIFDPRGHITGNKPEFGVSYGGKGATG